MVCCAEERLAHSKETPPAFHVRSWRVGDDVVDVDGDKGGSTAMVFNALPLESVPMVAHPPPVSVQLPSQVAFVATEIVPVVVFAVMASDTRDPTHELLL